MPPDPTGLSASLVRNVFIRSDQYNFIRHGIPALKVDFGYEPDSSEQKIFKNWLTNRYHAPSDDTAQPVDITAAGLYEDIIRQLTQHRGQAAMEARLLLPPLRHPIRHPALTSLGGGGFSPRVPVSRNLGFSLS